MKLQRLTEYGIPERFIARWRATIGENLLDWQADAVRQHDLLLDVAVWITDRCPQ